jgi:hypothetical protein
MRTHHVHTQNDANLATAPACDSVTLQNSQRVIPDFILSRVVIQDGTEEDNKKTADELVDKTLQEEVRYSLRNLHMPKIGKQGGAIGRLKCDREEIPHPL